MRDWPKVEVAGRPDLRAWLAKHHEQQSSIWLVHGKKAAGARYLPYDAIVEEALCFGWIDSLPRALDPERTMLLLSPRKPASTWSAPNRERADRMIREGLMTPAGLAKVAAAKRDGSWDRLCSAEDGALPGDLAKALEASPAAYTNFNGFSAAKRRNLIAWVTGAKRDATRMRRIHGLVNAAAEGRDALEWKPTRAR